MAEIKEFKPKPKYEFTKFTHDASGKLLPAGSGSVDARCDDTTDPDNHLANIGRCGLCGHEANVVTPIGAFPLECPECRFSYMVLVEAPHPSKYWVCNCGNSTYHLTTKYPVCTVCGAAAIGWANA